MAFDTSALTAYVQENADKFFERSILAGKSLSLAEHLEGLKGATKIPNLAADSDDIFQDGTTCTTTTAGGIIIDQRLVDPKNVNIKMKFCTKDLEPFFMRKTLPAGSYYDTLGSAESQFMALLEKTIMKKIELTAWQGIEGGVAADASFNLYDGWNQIIADEIVALTIPVGQQIAIAETKALVIGAFEDMRKALPIDQYDEAQDGDYVLLTSSQSKRNYEEAMRDNVPANVYKDSFNREVLDGTNIPIIAVGGLFGLGKSVLVKKSSFWIGTDLISEIDSLTIEAGVNANRGNIYIHGDFKFAPQFNFPEELVVNNY